MSFFHATKQERRDKKAADQFLAVTAARDQRRAFFRALKDGVIVPGLSHPKPVPAAYRPYMPITKELKPVKAKRKPAPRKPKTEA